MLDPDDIVFRTRALGQSHPFTAVAHRYHRGVVDRERDAQPLPELGVWAGHAITAGYCLRRVEEDETGRTIDEAPPDLPDDLDEAASHIAVLVRTEGADPYLLFPEDQLVIALDRMIAGEVERRFDYWDGPIPEDVRSDIIEYLTWWVIKGYALRIAERLVSEPVDQAK